jgi:hypothetical protein
MSYCALCNTAYIKNTEPVNPAPRPIADPGTLPGRRMSISSKASGNSAPPPPGAVDELAESVSSMSVSDNDEGDDRKRARPASLASSGLCDLDKITQCGDMGSIDDIDLPDCSPDPLSSIPEALAPFSSDAEQLQRERVKREFAFQIELNSQITAVF